MEELEKYRLIENYLKDKLSPEEKSNFEDLMEKDPSFSQEVSLHKQAMAITQFDFLNDMKSKLDDADKEYHRTRSTKKKIGYGIVTFSFVSILCAVWFKSENRSHGLIRNTKDRKELPTSVNKQKNIQPKSVSTEDIVAEVKKESLEIKPKSITPDGDGVILGKHNTEANNERLSKQYESEIKKVSQIDENTQLENSVTLSESDDSSSQKNTFSTSKSTEQKSEINCQKPKISVELVDVNFNRDLGSISIESEEEMEYLLEEYDPDFSLNTEFSNLNTGSYSIKAKNTEGCVFEYGPYEIKKEKCATQTEYGFNMSFEEHWEVPVNTDAQVSIMQTSNGEIVFFGTKQGDENLLWDGRNKNGQPCEIGTYKVFITSLDGKMCEYRVVIEK